MTGTVCAKVVLLGVALGEAAKLADSSSSGRTLKAAPDFVTLDSTTCTFSHALSAHCTSHVGDLQDGGDVHGEMAEDSEGSTIVRHLGKEHHMHTSSYGLLFMHIHCVSAGWR
jgi:hypothetical protein